MSAEKKEEGEAEAAPKKGKKKLIFIILGVVLLIAGAGVPMFLMGGGEKEGAEEEQEAEAHKAMETADLGQFVVNLSESSSFLKVRITIEYDAGILDHNMEAMGIEGGKAGGKGHGGGEEGAGGGTHPVITKKMNQIQDAILRILSSKHAAELLTLEGKDKLKDELLEGINEAIGTEEPPVSNVFFTEFIIQ